MRVTSKGQVTIPIDIRERLGIQPNTDVEFVVNGGRVELRKAGKPAREARKLSRGEALVARMRAVARASTLTGMSTDEVMRLTRGEWSGSGRRRR